MAFHLQLLYPAAKYNYIICSSIINLHKCSIARASANLQYTNVVIGRHRCLTAQSWRCSNSNLINIASSANLINIASSANLINIASSANDNFESAEIASFTQNQIIKINHNYVTDFGSRKLMQSVASMAMICSLHLLSPSPVEAADPVQTYNCVMNQCRMELIRCIGDASCAANLTCLETCNNRPDETQCLMRCGDLFENRIVDEFNTCVVSTKKCVPQKPDDGSYPVPASDSTVQNFDPLEFKGKWYISSGLNPTFDTYDCQIQDFSSPSPHTITAKLSWRINTLDGGFFTRSTVQNLVQDARHPGILHNHDNELLHYEDEWFILSAQIENKADDYVFVYYKGRNDAWDGFGGAVVYTRSEALPSSIVPQLTEAAHKVGLDFTKFQITDNTCPAEVPLLERLEKKVQQGMLKMREEFANMGFLEINIGDPQKTFLSYLGIGLRDSH